ncbi:MAG: hypothetical protein RLZZ200_2615 [Pseudomonadota bacterium]|jgi:hypothetical protein
MTPTKGIVAVVFTAGVVWFTVSAINSAPNATVSPAAEDPVKVHARNMTNAQFACEGFVKESLHDPDSAKFSDSRTYATTPIPNDGFEVIVTGRAKNGFGGVRQLAVQCKTRRDAGQWVPVSLKELR